MKKTKEPRHMVNILDKEYKAIYDYCRPRNLIIGRWMSSICLSFIRNTVSGSK